MARLVVHAEGPTEVRFVRGILPEHLTTVGYDRVDARIVGSRKSGICSWGSALKEIVSDLKRDRGCVISTMVDFYGLPATRGKAWPGREAANSISTARVR